jgi:hypothetical protein
MALVNIDTVLRTLLQRLDKLSPQQGIELLSYKRNRYVALVLQDDSTVLVRERGYRTSEKILCRDGLLKYMKSLIKYEFPRSRKLRIYQLEGPADLNRDRKKL